MPCPCSRGSPSPGRGSPARSRVVEVVERVGAEPGRELRQQVQVQLPVGGQPVEAAELQRASGRLVTRDRLQPVRRGARRGAVPAARGRVARALGARVGPTRQRDDEHERARDRHHLEEWHRTSCGDASHERAEQEAQPVREQHRVAHARARTRSRTTRARARGRSAPARRAATAPCSAGSPRRPGRARPPPRRRSATNRRTLRPRRRSTSSLGQIQEGRARFAVGDDEQRDDDAARARRGPRAPTSAAAGPGRPRARSRPGRRRAPRSPWSPTRARPRAPPRAATTPGPASRSSLRRSRTGRRRGSPSRSTRRAPGSTHRPAGSTVVRSPRHPASPAAVRDFVNRSVPAATIGAARINGMRDIQMDASRLSRTNHGAVSNTG